MKNKQDAKKNVPALRFPGFTGDWEERKLSEICKVRSGGTPKRDNPDYWNGDIPWITTSLIDFNAIDKAEEFITEAGLLNSSAKIFPQGTVLMAMYGQGRTRGRVAIVDIPAATNQACAAIIPLDKVVTGKFLFQNLAKRYNEIRELSNQGGQENLNAELIKGILVSFPSWMEQQKIASFFCSIDERLQQLQQQQRLLEQYKKGCMQQIFRQQIGYKDEKGKGYPEWIKMALHEVLIERREKNTGSKHQEVFSVAKNQGVVNQIEHLGRSYSSIDISSYKVVYPDDIIYTKSPTTDFPFGIIKQNKTGRVGVVSVLYAVYKPANRSLAAILDYYFSSWINVYNYLNPLVQRGPKNTMNIGNSDFLHGSKLALPVSEDEQTKIANFLSSLDDQINIVKQQITLTQQFKKGLLQQMFV